MTIIATAKKLVHLRYPESGYLAYATVKSIAELIQVVTEKICVPVNSNSSVM